MLNNKPIPFSDFEVGKVFDFGEIKLSEQQIIDYANQWDPLPFHISKQEGKKSIFRGLIASGPQIFHEIHKNYWLPLFGQTVICGIGVNNWKFIRPIYPNKSIFSKVTITQIEPNKHRNYAKVDWFYEFIDIHNDHYQTLEMFILHST